ncbi:MAG: ABC transporter ATP-binding protein [Deltaproteobacteria bacterium]|nr:ABC transporter ATP-binding protein [Deltaproteobacteria bacterium]
MSEKGSAPPLTPALSPDGRGGLAERAAPVSDGGGGVAGSSALVLEGIGKRFGAVVALDDVSMRVERATVHAVCGENGAGKSTLMRVVAGLVVPDRGAFEVLGARYARLDPRGARAAGVGMVHQHFMLVDTLSVAENVVLGAEPTKGPLLDRAAAEAEVARLASTHGLEVDARAKIADLSVGERQRVEILKALRGGARLLILDEPTAVLTPHETRALLALVKKLAKDGTTVVVVTHKLDEVMEVASRASILRRGRHEGDVAIAETSAEDLARRMVGREVHLGRGPDRVAPIAKEAKAALALDRVSCARIGAPGRVGLDDVSLEVREGEVLGVAGVEGNGQHELWAVTAGLVRPSTGRVRLGGDDVTELSTAERFARGLGSVPADRHREGLVLGLPLWENVALGGLGAVSRHGALRVRAMRERADRLLRAFDVRPPDASLPASALSGGNQQKVVVARELERAPSGAEVPRALVVAQPTRGVDVGAIEEIWRRLGSARDRGTGVLLVSSELTELLALSDRIAVLVRGRIVAVLDRAEADREKLGELMLGARAAGAREGAA